MSDEAVELVFTDLPEPVGRRVPEYMRGVPLRWRIVEPGCRTADVLQGRRPRDVLVSGRL